MPPALHVLGSTLPYNRIPLPDEYPAYLGLG